MTPLNRGMRIGICVAVLNMALATASAPSTQTPEWRLTRPLSDAEKTSVLALAARLRIDRPGVIINEVILQPLGCEAVRIESVPAITGNRRTWQRVWVTNSEWPRRCPSEKPDSPRVDNWVLAYRIAEVGVWRVQTPDGVLDVETPSTLPYPDVVAIVEAVRTDRLVNRLPPEYRGNMARVPKVDAKSISVIWTYQRDPSLYKVNFGNTNVVLLVAVRGSRVELRGWMTEMAVP